MHLKEMNLNKNVIHQGEKVIDTQRASWQEQKMGKIGLRLSSPSFVKPFFVRFSI